MKSFHNYLIVEKLPRLLEMCSSVSVVQKPLSICGSRRLTRTLKEMQKLSLLCSWCYLNGTWKTKTTRSPSGLKMFCSSYSRKKACVERIPFKKIWRNWREFNLADGGKYILAGIKWRTSTKLNMVNAFFIKNKQKEKHNNVHEIFLGGWKKFINKIKKIYINLAGIKFGRWRISLNLAGI